MVTPRHKNINSGLKKPPSELQLKARKRNLALLRHLLPAKNMINNIAYDCITEGEYEKLNQLRRIMKDLADNWKLNAFDLGIGTSIKFTDKEEYKKFIQKL